MNIKGVLFDLDGTLLDTSELIVESFRYTFKQHCNYDISVSEVHDFFGKSLRLAMETLGKDKADELIVMKRNPHVGTFLLNRCNLLFLRRIHLCYRLNFY